MHSTNYFDTLICPAEDCTSVAKIPDKPGSVAAVQYDLLSGKPYQLTSDDVLSRAAARRKGIEDGDYATFRAEFFSKGQACFRASPLTKTHGWAVHSNADGYVALLSPDDAAFSKLLQDSGTQKRNAMRSKRA